jgi:hypothetical protein
VAPIRHQFCCAVASAECECCAGDSERGPRSSLVGCDTDRAEAVLSPGRLSCFSTRLCEPGNGFDTTDLRQKQLRFKVATGPSRWTR